MAESCCGSCEVAAGEHGLQRRVLIAVLVVNAVMFAAELGAGLWAHSSALQADSIDMLIDEIGFAATGPLYAAAGLALMLAIVLHWRADLWHVHAPANAR